MNARPLEGDPNMNIESMGIRSYRSFKVDTCRRRRRRFTGR